MPSECKTSVVTWSVQVVLRVSCATETGTAAFDLAPLGGGGAVKLSARHSAAPADIARTHCAGLESGPRFRKGGFVVLVEFFVRGNIR